MTFIGKYSLSIFFCALVVSILANAARTIELSPIYYDETSKYTAFSVHDNGKSLTHSCEWQSWIPLGTFDGKQALNLEFDIMKYGDKAIGYDGFYIGADSSSQMVLGFKRVGPKKAMLSVWKQSDNVTTTQHIVSQPLNLDHVWIEGSFKLSLSKKPVRVQSAHFITKNASQELTILVEGLNKHLDKDSRALLGSFGSVCLLQYRRISNLKINGEEILFKRKQ